MNNITTREWLMAEFAYKCAEKGDNFQMMMSRLYRIFGGGYCTCDYCSQNSRAAIAGKDAGKRGPRKHPKRRK